MLENETAKISVDEAIRDIDKNISLSPELQYGYEEWFQKRAVESEKDYAHLQALKDHFRHKKYWSWFLMAVMFSMVVYQSVLLGIVGSGLWDFTKYAWLLPALLVQNLAKVVGLAVFVVKALFKDLR